MSQLKMHFIDHYDSFSFNVVDWLRRDLTEIVINHLQFDDLDAMQRVYSDPQPIVISPGPHHPDDAEQTRVLVESLLGVVPILGICLGHQILGRIGGFQIVRASAPFHGAAKDIYPSQSNGLFRAMPRPFGAATYNSLKVQHGDNVDTDWQISAQDTLGEIQGLTWRKAGKYPAYGLQFHPESFLTQNADILRSNWLEEVRNFFHPTPSLTHTSATAPLSMPS